MFYNGAYSSYNALQVQAGKNSPLHGLQFQASYTWAKDMDTLISESKTLQLQTEFINVLS